jgi:ABC-type transport system involved in multi-copper enzyme maturation permease subunit
MRPPVAPYRSQLPTGRDAFTQLVRAEYTKLRSVRTWMLTLLGAVILLAAFAWLGSQERSGTCIGRSGGPPTCHSDTTPHVPVGPDGTPVVDTFSFVHRSLDGDGTLTVRVRSLTEQVPYGPGPTFPPGSGPRTTVPWAKAGIIVKAGTAEGSAYAAVLVTQGHGVRMQDDFIHDAAGLPGAVGPASPRWLRLTRRGDALTGWDSLDGRHWTRVGTITLAGLPRTAQAGVFVTSPSQYGDDGASSSTVAAATFDHVRLAGAGRAGWSTRVVGADATPSVAESVRPSPVRDTAGAFSLSGSGDIAPLVAAGQLGSGQTTGLLAAGAFGLIAIIVLAAVFIASEYRRGLIRTTLTASPRRGRALLAKAAVIGMATFAAGAIGTALAERISRHELMANGNYVFPLAAWTAVRVAIGTGLLFALAAILVLALATILRRSAGAIVAGVVLFVLPFVIAHPLSSGASRLLFSVTPVAGFAVQGTLPRFAQVASAYTVPNGYYPLGPWAGLAVLAGYAAALLAAAVWVIRRRDA